MPGMFAEGFISFRSASAGGGVQVLKWVAKETERNATQKVTKAKAIEARRLQKKSKYTHLETKVEHHGIEHHRAETAEVITAEIETTEVEHHRVEAAEVEITEVETTRGGNSTKNALESRLSARTSPNSLPMFIDEGVIEHLFVREEVILIVQR